MKNYLFFAQTDASVEEVALELENAAKDLRLQLEISIENNKPLDYQGYSAGPLDNCIFEVFDSKETSCIGYDILRTAIIVCEEGCINDKLTDPEGE